MKVIAKRFLAPAGFLFGVCILLTGCARSTPFARPGTWHETNAPMHNIAVELVNPQDLHNGRGDRTLTGEIAVSAVGSGLSSVSGSSTSSGPSSTVTGSSGPGASSNFNLGMSADTSKQ